MYNLSKTYLLPLIGKYINLKKEFFKLVINTYIEDNYKNLKNCIFLEIKYDFDDEDFLIFEHNLITHKLFVEKIEDSNKVIFAFRFPKHFLEEYLLFKKSIYSKFSTEAKITILEFWTHIYGELISFFKFIKKVKQVLYKDKYLKLEIESRLSSEDDVVTLDEKIELGEYVDLARETFKWKERINEEEKVKTKI